MFAKVWLRLAGDAMHPKMKKTMLSPAPVNTLFEALLEAISIHGRNTPLVEDMKKVEETYGDILKKSLALGKIVSKVSQPHENVGVMMPNVTNTICLIMA